MDMAQSQPTGGCRVCRCKRRSSLQVVGALLVSLMLLTLLTHHHLSNIPDCPADTPARLARAVQGYDGDEERKAADLRAHVDELRAIKASVGNELRQLENRRQTLQGELAAYVTQVDKLKAQAGALRKEVSQMRLALQQLRFEQEETKAFVPSIKAPKRVIFDGPAPLPEAPPPRTVGPRGCRMESCFDFSRCSLVSGFPIFFYDPEDLKAVAGAPTVEEFVLSSVVGSLADNGYITDDPSVACMFLVLVGEVKGPRRTGVAMEHFLRSLPYWGGDGGNHLLLTLARAGSGLDPLEGVDTGRALLAQSAFLHVSFRPNFDILLPPSRGQAHGDVWFQLPPLSPARRRYLVSFWGEVIPTSPTRPDPAHRQPGQPVFDHGHQDSQANAKDAGGGGWVRGGEGERLEIAVVSWLKEVQTSLGEAALFDLSCGGSQPQGLPGEWGLCGDDDLRRQQLTQSTFALLLVPLNATLASTVTFQTRLYEALKYGAIPVILGSDLHLPYAEILDWTRAALTLPLPRISEIPFFLRTFSDSDISDLRRQGRLLWETYFGSTLKIVDTTLALLRTRLQIPALPTQEERSVSVFNATFTPLKVEGPGPEPESDEVLGPMESCFPSEKFRRNYTLSAARRAFNGPGDPFNLYPFTPFEPTLPSEAKFMGSSYGFRPIGQGVGGAGKEFSEALGGNMPREQFTIVMLTYEREMVLLQALQRLKGIPFLNKVLVVWNNPSPPSTDLRWPDIGVPLEILRTRRNSLNNRFLPYDAIETEAVLSIDDDAHLRHDEIVFGFRVWREERDRVVGFPGRFHAWDAGHQSWHYNSNYSCELSMVLTGAAFFHKYYAYLYSYVMPQAIRDKVDQYTNCEDIAMNFLVSHITRKPPVKVTSRWTFRCPGCPNTLSSNDTHFEERHRCTSFFVEVYGYMPLLYSQYRVDSVLFKTRLPHDKQKCFKYI